METTKSKETYIPYQKSILEKHNKHNAGRLVITVS
jgi:hypothetical protein